MLRSTMRRLARVIHCYGGEILIMRNGETPSAKASPFCWYGTFQAAVVERQICLDLPQLTILFLVVLEPLHLA